MGHKNRSTGAESGLCCVSYGVSAVFLWHAHRNRIKALTGGMDNGRLGHLQATCDGADRRHGDLLLVRGGTRCGSVRAAKRIKLSKLKTIKNLVYHFHIPPYQTTAEINQKVVYTTFRPVKWKALSPSPHPPILLSPVRTHLLCAHISCAHTFSTVNHQNDPPPAPRRHTPCTYKTKTAFSSSTSCLDRTFRYTHSEFPGPNAFRYLGSGSRSASGISTSIS